MVYKFNPPIFSEDNFGVVKQIDGTNNYSTHLAPYDFELSNEMFECGKEYEVSLEVAEKLFDSGYGLYINPNPLEYKI